MKNRCIHFLIVPLLIITTETAYGMDSGNSSYPKMGIRYLGLGTVLGGSLGFFWAKLHDKFFPPTVRRTFDAKYLEVNSFNTVYGPLKLIVDYKARKAYRVSSSYDVQMQEKNKNGEPVWKIKLSEGDTVEYNPKTDISYIPEPQ